MFRLKEFLDTFNLELKDNRYIFEDGVFKEF